MDSALKTLIKQSSKQTVVLWAADCAERALEYFEIKFPKDKRPQQAIAAARAWARGAMTASEVARAAEGAHEAARRHGSNETSAAFAARAAGLAANVADDPKYIEPMLDSAIAAVRESSLLDPEKAEAQERQWQFEHLHSFQP